MLSNKRNPIIEIMEDILVAFIEDHAKNSDPLYQQQIQRRAIEITTKIEKQYYGIEDVDYCSKFKASQGWFWKFCQRHKVKHVKFFGESALVDKDIVKNFVEEFEAIASEYSPHLIFNFDECGLFWRKTPTGGYTTASIPSVPGNKPKKERVTLLLGNSAY